MTNGMIAHVDLKILVEQLPIAVSVCDAPSGLVRLYNRRAAELWGREPALGEQRFCGAVRLYRTDGSYLPHAETPMAEVVMFGGQRNDDVVVERPDGSRITVRVNIVALRDSNGRPVGVVNAFHEVTEQKQMEEAAARLAAIVVGAEDAIISKSLDGQIFTWNRAAEALFGYTEAEVLGKSITIIIPPERLYEEEAILARIRRGVAIEHFETERVTKDGRRVQISLSVSPVRDRVGRIIGASKVARDISLQKQLESVRTQLEQEREELLLRERMARAEAETANKSKDEFLAVLSHELRNPVGVIVYALAALDASEELDQAGMPQLTRARSVIGRQTQVLARLLDDLLDVARISSRRIDLHNQDVDLRTIVRQAVETERHRIEQKRQQVRLRLGDDPVLVVGDAIRLHQVVGNIINNAWKYTGVGGTIDVAVDTETAWATVRVLDNGAGIPPDRLEAVFELFTQANPSLARTEGGLGIGLTLVRQLVELHGGDVQARSAGLGKGAEFIVRLPLARGASKRSNNPASATRLAPKRILVVDDSANEREMLSMALRMSGHEVFEAATGHEGIEMARRYTPAIVLLDISLPDIDGYELPRRIRQTSDKAVRLIALTGHDRPVDRSRAEQAGFDAHAVKPIEPSRLTELLNG